MSAKRQRIQPEKLYVRGGAKPLYSHVVTIEGGGKMIFISGQVARDVNGNAVGKGDMRAQIQQVGENIKAALEAVGASLSDLVKTTTFVTDIDEFFKHADVRSAYFGDAMPTSATVEVKRLSGPEYMIEIQAMAVV